MANRNSWTRRDFLSRAAYSTALAALPAAASSAFATPSPTPLRGRFLTHVSVFRVNQIEVTPTRNLGEDEAADNSPARIRSRREAFARGCPDGKMTWAISWLALKDTRQEYQEARRLLADYHDKLWRRDHLHSRRLLRAHVRHPRTQPPDHPHSPGHDLRPWSAAIIVPQCLVAGFMDAENQRFLATGRRHSRLPGTDLEPARHRQRRWRRRHLLPLLPQPRALPQARPGPADFIDCVCLDGWTCDFLTARREGFEGGFNSRLGVGPIETVGNLGAEAGRKEMMDTTAMHFDTGHALNGFGFVTGIWEISIGHDEDLTWWLQAVHDRWPDTQVMTEGEFGLEWRKHNPNNDALNYRFDAKGTGAPGSEKNLEIQWFMNRRFPPRPAAGLADQQQHPWPSTSPATTCLRTNRPGLQREWSLMNVLNQKGTRPQDKPTRLGKLPPENQHLIFAEYPQLRGLS